MGALYSLLFGRKEPETPIKGPGKRCRNIWSNNFRGIIGIIGALAIIGALCRPNDRNKLYRTVGAIWFIMFWFTLWQPVAVQAVGFIPIFAFPLSGVLSSVATCESLINENIVLMILGGWLHMLLNCSGMDKRLICCFLCCGGDNGYSATKILLKSMFAAFFLSIICNRLLVVSALLGYILPVFAKLSINPVAKLELNFTAYTALLCNGIATSAAIGSICIVHASLTTLQFKAMYEEKMVPEIFNYLQYSAYAVPTAILMFLLNMLYHFVLFKVAASKKKMSKPSMLVLKTAFTKNRSDLGKASCHEKMSVVFLILSLACYFTRWSKWIGAGWPGFLMEVHSSEMPHTGIKDATTAAIFVLVLHLLPKTCDFFIKECKVKETKDAPSLKMESGMLFWKLIDKNTDYSYIFLMGGSIALFNAIQVSGLQMEIGKIFESITKLNWNIGILIVVLLSVIFGNIMAGPGAQAVLMPFMLTLAQTGSGYWPIRTYLVALAVGLGTGFGFMIPFLHTTCYFTKHMGKVRAGKQVKYALMSVLICTVVLWVTLCVFAPLLWDPNGNGVLSPVMVASLIK